MDKNEPWCLLFYCYSYKLTSLFTSHHISTELFSSVFRFGSASINVKFHYGIQATTFFLLVVLLLPLRPFYHIRFYIATSHYTLYACTARITRQLGLPHFTRNFFRDFPCLDYCQKDTFLMYKKLGIVERVEELLDVIMLFVLTLPSKKKWRP